MTDTGDPTSEATIPAPGTFQSMWRDGGQPGSHGQPSWVSARSPRRPHSSRVQGAASCLPLRGGDSLLLQQRRMTSLHGKGYAHCMGTHTHAHTHRRTHTQGSRDPRAPGGHAPLCPPDTLRCLPLGTRSRSPATCGMGLVPTGFQVSSRVSAAGHPAGWWCCGLGCPASLPPCSSTKKMQGRCVHCVPAACQPLWQSASLTSKPLLKFRVWTDTLWIEIVQDGTGDLLPALRGVRAVSPWGGLLG